MAMHEVHHRCTFPTCTQFWFYKCPVLTKFDRPSILESLTLGGVNRHFVWYVMLHHIIFISNLIINFAPYLNLIGNIILSNVRQHNYFITQGNYIGYMFRLLFSHLQAYFVNRVTRCSAHIGIPSCLHSWNT